MYKRQSRRPIRAKVRPVLISCEVPTICHPFCSASVNSPFICRISTSGRGELLRAYAHSFKFRTSYIFTPSNNRRAGWFSPVGFSCASYFYLTGLLFDFGHFILYVSFRKCSLLLVLESRQKVQHLAGHSFFFR